MSSAISAGCLRAISTVWVDLFHALMKTKAVADENTTISMLAIKQDLDSCQQHLAFKEKELMQRLDDLTLDAKQRLLVKDVTGARRRLMDKRRVSEQLQKVSNSICVIQSHAEAIEQTTWNKELLQTLRASATAIRSLNVKGLSLIHI